MSRTIFHIDMDAFFASIEIVRNPALRGKPVIVGGRPDQRGVVSTCSYEARVFGVHSAMSLAEAKKRCPQAVFLEGNFSLYRQYSDEVIAIFCTQTPLVEVVSIDEAYLDVSEIVLKEQAKQLADKIHQEIKQKTGLTCSIGIASNKLVSKVASSHVKPNAIFEIPQGFEAQFLGPLPVENLPGVGKKTQQILNHHGIKKVADLQSLSPDYLIQQYGAWGYHYFLASRGIDFRPVEWEDRLPKSIGAETTFEKDNNNLEFLQNELKELTLKATRRMLDYKMRTRRISIKLRYNDFRTISRTVTLSTHYKDFETIFKEAVNLFTTYYSGEIPLRLVGVSLEQLTNNYWQPTFWD